MDPLEARNAHFNFAKLGTYAREYHRDFYGAMPDRLNAGIPSDRLYVEWPIGNDRTYRRLRGDDAAPSLEQAEREEVRYLLRASGPGPGDIEEPRGETHLLLEIPEDLQELKVRDGALALQWRSAVRSAFESAFGAGYAAVEFLRSADRGAYLLVPQPRPGTAP
jgi:predicted GNAT superfamily acetyltransferase